MKFIAKSENDTAAFAAKFAKSAVTGKIIALYGTLGAGKTVFARGFARGMGIEGHIPSPTFTIVQEYKIPSPASNANTLLFHMDLYRIPNSNSALTFGIEEYLECETAVKLIEWPERIRDLLPESLCTIHITHIDENTREITISE